MTDHQISDTPTIAPDAPSVDDHDVVVEALAVIDGALARMLQRDLVSTGEVADLLLDVRTLLTARQ